MTIYNSADVTKYGRKWTGLEMLTQLFNKICEVEKIPKDWETEIVKPLF